MEQYWSGAECSEVIVSNFQNEYSSFSRKDTPKSPPVRAPLVRLTSALIVSFSAKVSPVRAPFALSSGCPYGRNYCIAFYTFIIFKFFYLLWNFISIRIAKSLSGFGIHWRNLPSRQIICFSATRHLQKIITLLHKTVSAQYLEPSKSISFFFLKKKYLFFCTNLWRKVGDAWR